MATRRQHLGLERFRKIWIPRAERGERGVEYLDQFVSLPVHEQRQQQRANRRMILSPGH